MAAVPPRNVAFNASVEHIQDRIDMARYIGPKCKLSRREGTDLFLKSGVRSLESKCKAEAAPGQHGARRGRLSGHVRMHAAALNEWRQRADDDRRLSHEHTHRAGYEKRRNQTKATRSHAQRFPAH